MKKVVFVLLLLIRAILIINQIKTLETEGLVHREISSLKNKLINLRLVITTIKLQIKECNEHINSFAKESQEIHEEMINKVQRLYSLQSEVNDAQQMYQEKRQLSQEIHQHYVESLNQVRSLEQGIRLIEAEKKVKVELEMRERIKQKSLEKLKRGEKLSWEEFQVLTEDGLL